MTGNRSGCTLIIRQMCHNVPPTAINTSVEFILKTEICILWLYIHISRECGVLGNNKTHTLRSKSCNYALNVFKWCTKTLNSYSYCALTYKNNYIITNTKFKLTTTKLCQVRLLSPWSRWRSLWKHTLEIVYTRVLIKRAALWPHYRNRNTRHRGHPHAVQRYNSHASRFSHEKRSYLILFAVHHNWNSFICEAWPLHNMLFNTCWFVFLCHAKMRRAVAGCLMLVYVVALLAEQTEGHITFFSPKEMRELRVKRPSAF